MCQAFGVPCPGYRPQLKWTNDGAPRPRDLEDATCRRALFAEPQQKAMTEMMAVSLGGLSVGKALDGLEVEETGQSAARQPEGSPKHQLHGPFGVLFLPTRLTGGSHSPPDAGGPRYRHEIGDTASPSKPKNESASPRHADAPKIAAPPEIRRTLEMTPELLAYFRSHVVSFSSAARRDVTMCPWRNIHLPAAEETYKDLIARRVPKQIGLSLLHSLLAVSCFRRAPRDTTSAGRWADLGEQYRQEARQHLEIAIQEEILSLTQTNYEELLMALLSMTMLEIMCAKYNEAEYLLLETEYLIRTRGLPALHKSLPLRTLHHIYTYLRILTESTCGCILRNICPARPGSRYSLVTEASRHKLRSFRVADQSTETDLRMSDNKGTEAAQDDLHLEVMGEWQESLFPQLYGLPESLLGLLSQTIRLANEQELMQRDTEVDGNMIANLCRRTKVLEHNLLSWRQPGEAATAQCRIADRSLDDGPATSSGGNCNKPLTEAFHQAVILFYYRRVQNINGLMLQDRVRKVLDSLPTADGPHQAAPLLWPVFLAACEAIEPPLRKGLDDWLMQVGEASKISAFSIVAKMAREVWALREQKQDYTLSWFDVTTLGRCPIFAL
ncbi:hypothetical protein V2A60_009629 [Cordyceps javanica]